MVFFPDVPLTPFAGFASMSADAGSAGEAPLPGTVPLFLRHDSLAAQRDASASGRPTAGAAVFTQAKGRWWSLATPQGNDTMSVSHSSFHPDRPCAPAMLPPGVADAAALAEHAPRFSVVSAAQWRRWSSRVLPGRRASSPRGAFKPPHVQHADRVLERERQRETGDGSTRRFFLRPDSCPTVDLLTDAGEDSARVYKRTRFWETFEDLADIEAGSKAQLDELVNDATLLVPGFGAPPDSDSGLGTGDDDVTLAQRQKAYFSLQTNLLCAVGGLDPDVVAPEASVKPEELDSEDKVLHGIILGQHVRSHVVFPRPDSRE